MITQYLTMLVYFYTIIAGLFAAVRRPKLRGDLLMFSVYGLVGFAYYFWILCFRGEGGHNLTVIRTNVQAVIVAAYLTSFLIRRRKAWNK